MTHNYIETEWGEVRLADGGIYVLLNGYGREQNLASVFVNAQVDPVELYYWVKASENVPSPIELRRVDP